MLLRFKNGLLMWTHPKGLSVLLVPHGSCQEADVLLGQCHKPLGDAQILIGDNIFPSSSALSSPGAIVPQRTFGSVWRHLCHHAWEQLLALVGRSQGHCQVSCTTQTKRHPERLTGSPSRAKSGSRWGSAYPLFVWASSLRLKDEYLRQFQSYFPKVVFRVGNLIVIA